MASVLKRSSFRWALMCETTNIDSLMGYEKKSYFYERTSSKHIKQRIMLHTRIVSQRAHVQQRNSRNLYQNGECAEKILVSTDSYRFAQGT